MIMNLKSCLFAILLFLLVFAGCAESNPTKSYTVDFDSQGATVPASPTSKTVTPPATTVETLPVAPTKTDYTFTGWRTEAYGGGAVFTGSTVVTASITVYATWTSDTLASLEKREVASVTGTTDDSYNQQSDLNEDGDVLDSNESFTHNINSFTISKYEVTYELWYTVYRWAILPENGYTIANAGKEGSAGVSGEAPTTAKLEPVTMVSWRDVIVWCNAYSQMTGLTPAYFSDAAFTIPLTVSTNSGTVSTTDGSEDKPYVNWSANGYRLPTEGEWQYAAGYKDGTSWTPFNFASGAVTYHDDTADVNLPTPSPDGKDANDAVSIYKFYWDGSTWVDMGTTKTENVGTKTANLLGLYDMSGNVFEWCWDWEGSYPAGTQTDYQGSDSSAFSLRVARGGSFNARFHQLPGGLANFLSNNLKIGNRGYGVPGFGNDSVGLRVARNN